MALNYVCLKQRAVALGDPDQSKYREEIVDVAQQMQLHMTGLMRGAWSFTDLNPAVWDNELQDRVNEVAAAVRESVRGTDLTQLPAPLTADIMFDVGCHCAGWLSAMQPLEDTLLAGVDLLLRKNENYGGSAFVPPVMVDMHPLVANLCRMSDKVARINSLTNGSADVVGESLRDTVFDLFGYAMLWLSFYSCSRRDS